MKVKSFAQAMARFSSSLIQLGQAIQKFYDMFHPVSPGLLKTGNWYVRYSSDNRRSKWMTYDAARDYAEIFGGQVYHKSEMSKDPYSNVGVTKDGRP